MPELTDQELREIRERAERAIGMARIQPNALFRLLTEIERLRAAAERWQHITEQAYLATSDDGALLLTVYLADDTDVPFLTSRERAQLAGDAPPYGMVSGAEAITRSVDADRAAVAQLAQSHPAASAADGKEG